MDEIDDVWNYYKQETVGPALNDRRVPVPRRAEVMSGTAAKIPPARRSPAIN